MRNPNTILPGQYKTITGFFAYVWNWGECWPGQWGYKGTIEDQGIVCWDKNGKDLQGNDDLIIVLIDTTENDDQ